MADPISHNLKPHPGVLTAIVLNTHALKKDNPQANAVEVLYLVIKQTLNSAAMAIAPDLMVSTCFVYYINAYRAMIATDKDPDSEASCVTYDDAALSLFDLYLQCPHDVIVRRMLPMVTEALREVTVARQSASDQPLKESLGSLSTLALLSQTLPFYVKGRRRQKNYEYVTWLKTLFEKVMNSNDLTFMNQDEKLKAITKQIVNHNPVILVK
jgi:hypothetical protein